MSQDADSNVEQVRVPKRAVCTGDAPEPVGPYSQAIRTRNLVFVSGQDPIDPTTGAEPSGFNAQVHAALTNLDRVLVAAGSSRDLIVKVSIYLADPSRISDLNQAYDSFFTNTVLPARTTISVPHLDHSVEIECIATAGGR